jgi:hypothetical protein
MGMETLLVSFLSDVMAPTGGARMEKVYLPQTFDELGMETFRVSYVLQTNTVE